MDKLKTIIEEKYKLIVLMFFIFLLILGLFIFNDYGISWDEPNHIKNGINLWNYITNTNDVYLSSRNRTYGPAFDLFVIVIGKIFQLSNDIRMLFFISHLLNFLLFNLSLFFYYKVCKKEFKNWKIGLLGCIFLILSPRIFADSFYNIKDLPFLSLFIISIYTLIVFLNEKNFLNALLHALSCGLLIDIRIMGVIMPAITFVFYFLDTIVNKDFRKNLNKIILNFILYFILLIVFIILFWPFLWHNPIYNFTFAFNEMSRYPWAYTVLYFGKFIKATNIPWHYAPVWIAITTPVLYVLFFLLGIFSIFISFGSNNMKTIYVAKRDSLIFLTCFFIPLFAVIILKSNLYDGWRQLYFIYPAFILLALAGLNFSYNHLKKRLNEKVVNTIFIVILAANFSNVAYFMIKNHPFQNVYFNEILQGNMLFAKKSFDMDYWGLSYRKALEYILRNDPRKKIKIKVANFPGVANLYILSNDDQKRLAYVDDVRQANYFLSNYRGHPKEFSYDDFYYEDEFYSIKVADAKIMVVYKFADK